jgi:hypothetical protein
MLVLRFVEIANVDLPTISLYAGSYTESGTINGALLSARFTAPTSCAYRYLLSTKL